MKLISLIILVLCSLTSCISEASYSDPIKITDKLSESFEGLSGVNNSVYAFTQGKSVRGWFSSQTSFIVSDGTSNVGGLYSFGSSGDRALGAQNSLKTKIVVFGIAIISDEEIHAVDVKFTGEQWRYGGDNPDTNVLSFDYCVLTTDQYQNGGWGANTQSTSLWISVSELAFYGSNDTAVGPVRFSQQFSRTLQTTGMGPDKVLQLRWTAHNNHDGLGIDDFEVHATTDSSGGGGQGASHEKWKILAVAGWSAVGFAVVGIFVFAFSRWKQHRKLAKYSTINAEAPHDVQQRVHAPAIYGNYQAGERQGFIGV